jgi:hypothetical protein
LNSQFYSPVTGEICLRQKLLNLNPPPRQAKKLAYLKQFLLVMFQSFKNNKGVFKSPFSFTTDFSNNPKGRGFEHKCLSSPPFKLHRSTIFGPVSRILVNLYTLYISKKYNKRHYAIILKEKVKREK